MGKGFIFIGLIVLCLVLNVLGEKPEDKNNKHKQNGSGQNGSGEKNDNSQIQQGKPSSGGIPQPPKPMPPISQPGDRKPQQSSGNLIFTTLKPINQQPDKQHNNCYGPNPVNPIIEDENNKPQQPSGGKTPTQRPSNQQGNNKLPINHH